MSCLRRRKETGEKPPRTKERMREPAAKELYWHGTTRRVPCGIRTGGDASPGRAAPKYLQHPREGGLGGGGAKRRPRDPELPSMLPAGTVPEARVCV